MVGRRSLNHHYFAYGALHYFQVISFAVLPVKIPNRALNLFDYTTERNLVTLLSRVLSALLGTGIVLLIYLSTKALFDYKAALFSSSFLAVSMGLVNLSHFATSDVASIFWFTLSCLMSTYVLLYKTRKWYLLSGLSSGFAAAVKYIGGLALITLIFAHFLGNRRSSKTLVIGILMALIGFLVANPVTIFSTIEFAEGFLKESSFNWARDANGPFAFLGLLSQLRNSLGIPLLLLCMSGLLYSLKLFVSKGYRVRVLMVWSMIFPHFLLIGSRHVSELRYIVPVAPFLLILTGKMMGDFTNLRPRVIQVASVVLFGIVIGYSLIYTIAADLQFTNDSRQLALKWVLRNVSERSKIEVTPYGPNIPTDRYHVILRPLNNMVDDTVALVNSNSIYRFFESVKAEWFKFGVKEKPYKTWYEANMDAFKSKTDTFDLGVNGLESRAPDYLIVSSTYFKRFSDDKFSVEGQFFDSLFSGKTNYKKVAEFKYSFIPWIKPQVEFVNPTIFVYRRSNATLE